MSARRGRHVEVFEAINGAWHYNVIGANGEKMAQSEGYSGVNGKSHAIRAADELHHDLTIWILDDEGDKTRLRPDVEVLSGPEGYPDTRGDDPPPATY